MPQVACSLTGGVAVPLSFRYGPESLDYRLQDSETVAALVDRSSLPNLAQILDRLPGVRDVVGVAGARESWMQPWEGLLGGGSPGFTPGATAAADPERLIDPNVTTGPPTAA